MNGYATRQNSFKSAFLAIVALINFSCQRTEQATSSSPSQENAPASVPTFTPTIAEPFPENGASEEIQSLWIDVGGLQVHYLQTGPATGRPVLLLHGEKYRASTWQECGTLATLAGAGYRVIAVDLPGHGETLPARVDETTWLFDLLKALDLKKPVIVSPSFSGLYSLPVMIAAPPRAPGYVAVAPVAIPAYKAKLKRIVVPVLAVWGERDQVVSREYQNMLADTVPEGRKATIPRA